jgi:hypothetical protein
MVLCEAETTGATRAGSTASPKVAWAAFPFASVTASVTAKGDPVESEGVQLIVGESEPTHPSGRFVQA